MKFLLMRGLYIIFFVLIVSSSFLKPQFLFAAISNNPAADTQIWVQVHNEFVTQNGKFYQKLTPGGADNQQNSPVYIAECVDTVNDRICTTGTVEGDTVLYQSDENLKKLQTQYGYVFKGITGTSGKPVQNPVTTDASGNIPVVYLESTIGNDAVRKFYAVNLIKGTIDTSKLPNLEKIHTGYSGGQQQAAFEIKAPTPVPTQKIEIRGEAPPPPCDPATDPNECRHEPNEPHEPHDPYGRVFDAVSLEPIPNAKVTLFVQRNNGVFSAVSPKETINSVINPWTTKEDGKFVYLIPSGTYQISVDLPNHTFPFDPKSLNPNYTKAYYELYYGQGFADKNIVEINTVEHRDIPVIPKGEPYHGPVKLLGYISELNKQKQIYEITGRVSHPLTTVEILGKAIDTSTTTRVLVKVSADKWGFFNATVNTNSLKSNETIGMVQLTKVDLTKETSSPVAQKRNTFSSFLSSLFGLFPRSSSYAEKEKPKVLDISIFPINPLLNNLEGYTYDTDKNALSNAKVSIYLTGSKKPYYEAKTDVNGYYAITSQHLPQMNYSIAYTTSEGKNYSITQKTFLEQNAKTILANNININKYLTQLSPFKVSAQERPAINPVGQNKNNPSVKNTEKIPNKTSNPAAYIIISLIILISTFLFISGIIMKFDIFRSHRRIYIFVTGMLLIMIFIFLLFSVFKSAKNRLDSQSQQSNPQTNASSTQAELNKIEPSKGNEQSSLAVTLPDISVKQWVFANKPVTNVPSANVYRLKENYSIQEAKAFINRWFQSSKFQNKNSLVVAKNSQGDQFDFHMETGAFSYILKNGISLNTSLDQYIQALPIYDPTLVIVAHYRKKSIPNITFYEIHRDWNKIGFPIFNSVGLLNHPENQTWSTETFSTKLPSPPDSDVYQTSDNRDGLNRFDHFNTLTLGVDDNNKKIYSIQSTLRLFENQKPDSKNLISYDEAVKKLENNQYKFLRTIPSGQGTVNLTKVYVNGKTSTDKATVVESIIAYLESPLPGIQTSLEPYYLFRGYSTLASGYRVNFYSAVPAISSKLTFKPFSFDSLFKQVFAATPIPTPDYPHLLTQQQAFYKVTQPVRDKSQRIVQDNIVYYYLPTPVDNVPSGLYLPCVGSADDCGKNFIDEHSPSLFMYAKENSQFMIQPQTTVTYEDPPIDKNRRWNIVVKENNTLEVNGLHRDFLYYEYQPLLFDRPTDGWVVRKDHLDEFIHLIGKQLNLTEKEEKRLRFEIHFSSDSIDKNDLFVGLIPQGEVDTKLPLAVSPNVKRTYRYHFYISGNIDTVYTVPHLDPIQRVDPLLIEFGSVKGE